MTIKSYSTTSSNNTSVNSSSLAEGQLPSTLNNSVREITKDIRDGFNSKEWFELGTGDQSVTWTRGSATTITVSADITTSHHVGRRVRVTGSNSGVLYGFISASAYSSPNTTLTFTFDSGSINSGDSTLTSVEVGSPYNNPANPVINTDALSEDSNILPPSQSSVKNFVTSGTVTLSNKSINLGNNTLTGTTAQFNTALSDNDFATLAGSEALTNKTLTSPVINTAISGTAFKDEDDMSSNSATAVASQQSIKAYVDQQVGLSDLDISDGSSTIAIDLDSETLGLIGGTGIDSSASSNNVTMSIDSTVATLTGTQSLTNKTISGSSNTLSNIGNSSLSNSSVSYGGVSLALGATDATPAFDLQDATNYPASSISGTIAENQLGSGINAEKIGNGDVNNTELSYINSLSSNAQTQINTKLTASNNLSDLSSASTSRTNLGLGSISTQGANNVTITGGSITGLGSPSNGSDAVNRTYVDNLIAGLKTRIICRVASTANVNLTNALENGDTLDGVTLQTGNRILIRSQTTASENGIYTVPSSGSASRDTDFDTASEISGQIVIIQEGSTNADKIFMCTSDSDLNLGSDSVSFSQVQPSNTGTVTSAGITQSGSEFSISGSPITSSGNVTLGVNRISATKIGSNSNISDTEFGYLDGVTSSIQTQLDNKATAGFSIAMSVALAPFIH